MTPWIYGLSPGFLCWPKLLQIKACAGLAYLFSKEMFLSVTLPLFMEHLLYIFLAADDIGMDKASLSWCLCLLVPRSLTQVEISASTVKTAFKLREFNFSFGKSKQNLFIVLYHF